MKVLAAFVVVLACAYFQTTSAGCTDGVLIMVDGGVGQSQAILRPSLLMTFGNGEQRYLLQPRSRYSKTVVRVAEKEGKVAISVLDKIATHLLKPRQICNLELELDQTNKAFAQVNCGEDEALVTLSYMCLL